MTLAAACCRDGVPCFSVGRLRLRRLRVPAHGEGQLEAGLKKARVEVRISSFGRERRHHRIPTRFFPSIPQPSIAFTDMTIPHTDRLVPPALSVLRIVSAYLLILHGSAKLFGFPNVAFFDNLQLVCPSCNEPARTGKHRTADGGGVRYCKKCDTEVGS